MIGRLAALIVRLYQVSVGKLVAPRCRFHPSCSEYAVQALRVNGAFFGGLQAVWRLIRCGPWTAGGIQPVKAIGGGSGAGPIRRALIRTPVRHG